MPNLSQTIRTLAQLEVEQILDKNGYIVPEAKLITGETAYEFPNGQRLTIAELTSRRIEQHEARLTAWAQRLLAE